MTNISINNVQQLREKTGVGVMAAKKALEESGGDVEKAVTVLRKAGQKIAEKKQNRQTHEGVVGTYLHSNKKLLAAVAVACETDFVALTDPFQELAHDLAMHVAAMNPEYLGPENVPADLVNKEKEIAKAQAISEGKSVKIIENIVSGKLNKFFEEKCLLKQKFFKDDEKTIEQVIQEAIQKLGENIKIKEFIRFTI
ncbi:MAG: translation elongation factor Ts [Patescibacteria group bacterium]|jgi:elongation factor Ts